MDIVKFDEDLATVNPDPRRRVVSRVKKSSRSIVEINRLYSELRTLEFVPLYIGRHGETQDDVDRKWSGWDDVALTPSGIVIVETSARFMRPLGIKRIVCSHLYRSKQTAQIFSDILGNIPVVEDWRLAAWNLGILAKQLEAHDKIEPYILNPYAKVPGGESMSAYKIRFVAGMEDATAQNIFTGPTLVITHSSGICLWEGGGDVANCSNFLQPGSVALTPGMGKKLQLIVGSMTDGDAA